MPSVFLVALLLMLLFSFIKHSSFGRLPSGDRLQRIRKSQQYKDGQFRNHSHTPDLTDGATYYKVLKEFILGRSKRSKPIEALPSKKQDLKSLANDSNTFVWFGHSSYFMKLDGKTFLVDPVLSGNASPVSFTTRSFAGSDRYTADDFPDIDYLLLTHDHWDHLDYKTLLALQPKLKTIITGLGTGEHLERWGFHPAIIIENDWHDHQLLEEGFEIHATPARHFSGRGLKRNQALWMSFVLKTPSMKIFIGGDSGYDTHFKTIGDLHGPFDLAILECGQYNAYWKHIHMMPEEVVQAAEDLRAKKFIPVHWAKFVLALHDWDDPILRVKKAAQEINLSALHPLIGELVNLNNPPTPIEWWKDVQ